MDNNEKIKVAITAGIVSVILLILVIFLAVTTKKDTVDDDAKLSENITDYASFSDEGTGNVDDSAILASSEDSADSSSTSASSEVMSYSEYVDSVVGSVSGNSFYETKAAVLRDVYNGLTFDKNSQLKEMMTYWEDGNMDAVRDLAHLERFEVMSYQLGGTDFFYYYGETNAEGRPNGKGIAVYANDQYYYGEWADGVRNGQGTWVAFYPTYSRYVVTEHLYTGSWAGDLPNGEGQEHFDYNLENMNKQDFYLQNAIGSFKDGKYNGDMYIISVDKDNNSTEWYGKCTDGNWEQVMNTTKDKNGKIPVLYEREDTKSYYYMTSEGSQNNGIDGMITGGSIAK